MSDYSERSYLSTTEAAHYLGTSVRRVLADIRRGEVRAEKSAGGQYRIDIRALKRPPAANGKAAAAAGRGIFVARRGGASQTMVLGDARRMRRVADESVHLAVTSPPYFNAKMYSTGAKGDLGNVHDLDAWLEEIGRVWGEVLRALQPGRKFFLNIMNLPVREKNTFRTLNLVGRSIDLCEALGFSFKRDIIWHKTNGVRAHFGTYPYPGGILLNNMHEHILEFQKPEEPGRRKYAHVSREDREASKLDREFWLLLKNSDVWTMKPERSGGGRSHVAPFPLELPERLIRAYSFVGETVLDPFAGSATTLAAAARRGRNGIGYELNRAIFEGARERLRESLL